MSSAASADITALANALRKSGADSEVTTFQVLQDAAGFLLSEMEARVPVKTGALRNSLSVQVKGQSVIIGPTEEYGAYVEFGTEPHVIRPKRRDGVLVFQAGGRTVYAKVVRHPGTKPQPFVRESFMAWVESLGRMAAEANIKVIGMEAK